MARGKGSAAKNKTAKGKAKAEEPEPQPDTSGPIEYDAKKDQEAIDGWGNIGGLGDWDVPDQPVSSPPPAPVPLPPAPITDFPKVNPRFSQQKRGSQLPPTIAMQRNASANANGWGESTIPGFSTPPDPNPALSPRQEHHGFPSGMHQPPHPSFMGGAGFTNPGAGGASPQPALNFGGLTPNNFMASPKHNHGIGPGMAPGSFFGGGPSAAMAPQNSPNPNLAFNHPGELDDDRSPPVVPLGEKGRSISPVNLIRAGLGGMGGGRSTSPARGRTQKANKKLPHPPQDPPVQTWGVAGSDVMFGGGTAAPAMGPQNPHNTNPAFSNLGDPGDDRPPVVSLGDKGHSFSNFIRPGQSGISGPRSMSPTHGKTLKATKKQQQQPQDAPVQAWGVAGPDVNLTSFAQAGDNRQGTREAWGGWGGDAEDEGQAWGGPATTHAAADNKWGSTDPPGGESGWSPPSPVGPGRAVKWQDSAIDPSLDPYTSQSSPQQTTLGKGKKGSKKGKKGKMSNVSDDEHHLDGGLSSSWGQNRGEWGDHADGVANDWGAIDGGDHDRGGGWGATNDYGRSPLPKVTVAAATRLSGGKSFVDSGLDPKDVNPTTRIEGSNGKALEPALHALYGMHRVAEGRIIWTLPYGHDPRVVWMNDFIERFNYALASYGFHRYIRTREKGALIVNVDYAQDKSPHDPAFDWLSFAESQKSRDRTVQRSIAANNPAKTCIVFMFLLSKSGNSVGMWRRRIAVPEKFQNDYRTQVRNIESDLRDKVYTVRVDPPYSELPRPPDSAPVTPVTASTKTRLLPTAAVTTITAPLLERKPKQEKKGNFITRWIRWGSNDSAKIKKRT